MKLSPKMWSLTQLAQHFKVKRASLKVWVLSVYKVKASVQAPVAGRLTNLYDQAAKNRIAACLKKTATEAARSKDGRTKRSASSRGVAASGPQGPSRRKQ